jgi:hypothetical protein
VGFLFQIWQCKKNVGRVPEKKTLDFEKGRSAAKMATSTFAYKNLALVN